MSVKSFVRANVKKGINQILSSPQFNQIAAKLATIGYKNIIPKNKKALGGRTAPLPISQTRWLLAHIEQAIRESDTGDLSLIARLCEAIRRDGVAAGVLSTRTNGLVRLPKKFTGADDLVQILEGKDKQKGIFDVKFPASELIKLTGDGVIMGLGIGEMVPVEGPNQYIDSILHRLDPEFLQFRWNENCFYYNSISGPIKIEPGDGRWILYSPGGLDEPWKFGLWPALGRAYIAKEHAFLGRQNYGSKLANPARVAYAPNSSTERQKNAFLDKLIKWSINSVFTLPEGWDVKLLESNGRGYEVFDSAIANADKEIIIALAGQLVTTLGSGGFSNGNIHQAIRGDLIQSSAESLAACINEQGIVPWVNKFYGESRLQDSPEISWDTTPPADLKSKADTAKIVNENIKAVNEILQPYSSKLNIDNLLKQFDLKEDDIEIIEKETPEIIQPQDQPIV